METKHTPSDEVTGSERGRLENETALDESCQDAIRAAMRSQPDVIIIGELADRAAAAEWIRAAVEAPNPQHEIILCHSVDNPPAI